MVLVDHGRHGDGYVTPTVNIMAHLYTTETDLDPFFPLIPLKTVKN